MKILILCTGNSCRSQIAQGFLQSFDSDLTVCSAGTEPSEKVNDKAVAVMNEVGIDISSAFPKSVNQYLDEEWDYVITVCGGANENCPMFTGHVKHRLHIGFDDPAAITGDEEFVMNEFRRIRNEIKNGFYAFYITEIKQQKLPTCSCND
jgi:arsenate reductase